MTLKILTEPSVWLLAEPRFYPPEGYALNTAKDDSEALVEFAGRNCYQSWANPSGRTTFEYVDNIMQQAHGSVLEHANYSVLVGGVSRSLTHEWVRHRAGFAYSQLSQRYVDESDTAFVIPPALIGTDMEAPWRAAMGSALTSYQWLSDALYAEYEHLTDRVTRRKTAREAARSVLPNATETKLVVTANVRAWRHFLTLRASEGAEREIRRLAVSLIMAFKLWAPTFFHDFEVYTGADGVAAGRCRYVKV